MSNDREVLQDWFAEQYATVEESGAVSAFVLEWQPAAGSGVGLHVMTSKAPGSTWGNAAAQAEVCDAIARRHANGIVTPGGSQQYVLAAIFGTATKPTRFLPFARAAQVRGGVGSFSSEPATPQGALGEGMRLLEQIAQGSFRQNENTAQVSMTIIDRSMRRQQELEADNRELFSALKLVILEFQKAAHEMRLKEIGAMRSAVFQKRMLELMPALLNLAGDYLPESTADQAILDSIAGSFEKKDLDGIVGAIAARPGGVALATVVQRRFSQYHERQQHEREEEQRLSEQLPLAEFEAAAQDAAGRAVDTIRRQSLPTGAANGKGNHANGAPTGKSDQAAESKPVIDVDATTTEQTSDAVDAVKLRDLLLGAIPSAEQLESLTQMLRFKGANELADELERQARGRMSSERVRQEKGQEEPSS